MADTGEYPFRPPLGIRHADIARAQADYIDSAPSAILTEFMTTSSTGLS